MIVPKSPRLPPPAQGLLRGTHSHIKKSFCAADLPDPCPPSFPFFFFFNLEIKRENLGQVTLGKLLRFFSLFYSIHFFYLKKKLIPLGHFHPSTLLSFFSISGKNLHFVYFSSILTFRLRLMAGSLPSSPSQNSCWFYLLQMP